MVWGAIAAAAGANKLFGKKSRGRSREQQWDAAGRAPDRLGFYRGLPDGGIGPQAQYLSNRQVARYNESQRQAARDVLMQHTGALQSYRHGGAYALQSGVANSLANVHMNSQIGEVDNLYNTREDQLKKARNEARNAGYLSAAIGLGSAALGAATGGGAGAAVAGLGQAAQQQSGQQQGGGTPQGGQYLSPGENAGPGPGQPTGPGPMNATMAPGGSPKGPGAPPAPGAPSPGAPGPSPSPGPGAPEGPQAGPQSGPRMDPGFGSPAMSDQPQGVIGSIADSLGVPEWHVLHQVAQVDPDILDDSVIETQAAQLRSILETLNG